MSSRILSSTLLLIAVTGCDAAREATAPPPARPNTAMQADFMCPPTCAAPIWNKQYLGTLAGTTGADPADVSDNGYVVGTATTTSGNSRAFYWTLAGGMKALPLPPGASMARATGISDNGAYAAGYVIDNNGVRLPVRWMLGTSPTVSWLPFCLGPGAHYGFGMAVNNAGVVAGSVSGKAVYWLTSSACPTKITIGGNDMPVAYGINDAGTIVGYPGYIYQYSPVVIGTLLQPSSAVAIGVSDAGKAVGISSGSAVYWPIGSTQSVTLGQTTAINNAVAVNDKGRLVWETLTQQTTTRYNQQTKNLSLSPRGVNVCGDIVGVDNFGPVLFKKTLCD